MSESNDEFSKVYQDREYQRLLLNEAIKQNVILYLPTGSGKTYIAQMVIKHFGSEIETLFSKGGKRSFFLCTTQALLYQQGKVLAKCLPYSVGYFTGSDGVDYWNNETWTNVLDKYQVIALTAQILFNLISSNRIQFRQISVIIFDECHHVESGHPMKQICDLYKRQLSAKLCTTRVIGLTATLLNSDVQKKNLLKRDLINQVSSLENALCARVVTCNTAEVIKFSTNPYEEFKIYDEPPTVQVIKDIQEESKRFFSVFEPESMEALKDLLNINETETLPVHSGGDIVMPVLKKPSVIKLMSKMVGELKLQFEEHGLNAGYLTALMMIAAVVREQVAVRISLLIPVFEAALAGFLAIRAKSDMILSQYPKDKRFLKYNSPKITSLLELLQNYPIEQRTLIFCQRRATVKMIYYMLKSLATNTPGYETIKPDFMVGVSSHFIQNTKLSELDKKQEKLTMNNFNTGVTNILVATDVLEEGIDIRNCNMVIKFDPPQHTRSYVQSKGRARSMGSQYFMMVKREDCNKYMNQYEQFKRIEADLKEISLQKRLSSLYSGKNERINYKFKEPEPFYVNGLESACMTLDSAPVILYQYVDTLQYDLFSLITPSIFQSISDDQCKVIIRMPPACPLYDDIHSEYYELNALSMKEAFRRAAFKACIQLYELGELNDELRPVNYFLDPTLDAQWYPNYRRLESLSDPASVYGLSRHIGTYEIAIAPQLLQSPQPNHQCYLHVISLQTQFPAELVNTKRKATYTQLLNSGEEMAIITRSTIPVVSGFPIYESLGQVDVRIALNIPIVLTKAQFEQLHEFHVQLFAQVLTDTVKRFLLANSDWEDPEDDVSADPMYLVCPVIRGQGDSYELNWPLILSVKSLPRVTLQSAEPTERDRKNQTFSPESYVNKVVIPWYRSSGQQQAYVVTEISSDTLDSRLGNSTITYRQYYAEKYPDIVIHHPNQFLLNVKPVTSHLNFIFPRSTKDKRAKLGVDEDYFEESLLPELCNLIEFPAVYWIKTLYLPTILYRISTLLACDSLRMKVGLKGLALTAKNMANASSFEPLTKFSPHLLVGKKQMYVPMDLKSKVRKETVDHVRVNQSVNALTLNVRELSIDDVLRGGEEEEEETMDVEDSSYVDEPDIDYSYRSQYSTDELMRKIENMGIDRCLDELTITDVTLRENYLRQLLLPGLYSASTQTQAVLSNTPDRNEIIYELKLEPAPKIQLLDIEFDPNTCSGPSQKDIYEAVVAHGANDIVNYERLETLGDSLLKFAASLALFTHLKTMDEGRLTLVKNFIVGNKNLYLAAQNLNLGGYIKIHELSPLDDWYPPRFSIPLSIRTIFKEAGLPLATLFEIDIPFKEILAGKVSTATEENLFTILMNLDPDDAMCGVDVPLDCLSMEDRKDDAERSTSSAYNFVNKIRVNDKVVADVVESLTGVYLKTCGVEGAMLFLQHLDILPQALVNVRNLLNEPQPSPVRSPHAASPMEHLRSPEVLEAKIGYKFNDKSFLLEALTHPTFNANRVTGSYQRLEFLGDSVIDFLVTSYLHENCASLSPGQITDVRSALVNNITFASYAVRLGLHKYLLFDSAVLNEHMLRFVLHQELRNHAVSDQVFLLNSDTDVFMPENSHNLSGRVGQTVDVPKALGDVFESLVGAIYLDSGKCLERVWYYLYNFMKKEIDEFLRNVPKNSIRLVYELNCHPKFEPPKMYTGGRVMVILHAVSPKTGAKQSFYGLGKNKLNAKLAAAKLALRHLAL